MAALSACAFAQNPTSSSRVTPKESNTPAKIALETSESLFVTMAAINSCGYDAELAGSSPLRGQIRNDVEAAARNSEAAAAAQDLVCKFYRDHQTPDSSRELSQYVSFALYLTPPPKFGFTVRDIDLPPDASNVQGLVPFLQKFYDAANLHAVWLKYQPAYEKELDQLHDPVAQMILKTDFYLKLPISAYLGTKFVVYVDPLVAPGQVNARNYGSDYFLVISPIDATLKMDKIRHTYLHYVLDPQVMRRANQVKRIEPLLELVRRAPMDESYKNDAVLMVVECFIRATEARMLGAGLGEKDAKAVEAKREEAVKASMAQGFILTEYFSEALRGFEREATGLRDAIGDMLHNIDAGRETKRIEGIQFAKEATADPLTSPRMRRPQMLDLAEQKLAENDSAAAYRIARKVLDDQSEDPARAMFILARAAALNKDVDGAQTLFERTLEIAREPRTIAWSHIYLGRILDKRCNRPLALQHYQAALTAGDTTPDTKTAADKGINEKPTDCDEEDKE